MKKNSLKSLVFWEKYKPTLLEKGKGIPIILLPRIRNIINGFVNNDEIEIKMNLLLHGSGGVGKSSLLNILTENTDFMKLKSTERGVDTIELIEEHCKNFTLPVKKKNQKGNPQGQKVVWLEEFDMTSVKFRQALRSFMDDYPNIRFVATANNIAQISRSEEDTALMSRFNLIDFDPETKEEVEYLKNQYFRYLKAVGKNSKIDITDDSIYHKILELSFPNLRKSVQTLQEIQISGSYEQYEHKNEGLNKDVYDFILDGNNDLKYNFFYVQENFPKSKTEDLLNLLGRPFFKYLLENDEDKIQKIGYQLAKLSKDYNYQYTLTIDPEMHLFNYVTEIKQLLV